MLKKVKMLENQIWSKLTVLKTSLQKKDSWICEVNFMAFKLMM